ncbi:hypothetical protein EDD85DRAFT_848954 [Armillaria nabsnona]|nr:hypothetical protein EDD85DRAFT_848954 [Armillaria nabsnona]
MTSSGPRPDISALFQVIPLVCALFFSLTLAPSALTGLSGRQSVASLQFSHQASNTAACLQTPRRMLLVVVSLCVFFLLNT